MNESLHVDIFVPDLLKPSSRPPTPLNNDKIFSLESWRQPNNCQAPQIAKTKTFLHTVVWE